MFELLFIFLTVNYNIFLNLNIYTYIIEKNLQNHHLILFKGINNYKYLNTKKIYYYNNKKLLYIQKFLKAKT